MALLFCSWVDDTPVTYTAWEKNEPNFANNDENSPTDIPKGGCAPEWTAFQGKCYKVVTGDNKKDWQEARTYCKNQGGNLYSVLAFLTTQMHKYTEDLWIGMNDVNWEMWMWIDNTVMDYTNWKPGMPTKEQCVEINSETGQWSTTSCSRYRSYICKTPKSKTHHV
uniref:C-type lectin domain-containing protein n=1 Tax=Periophthalmus magnuspinnatus TaxID=409849 RepID=A0A3B3ZFI9_9GOBI